MDTITLEHKEILTHCSISLNKMGFSPADAIVLMFGVSLVEVSDEVVPKSIKKLIKEMLVEQEKVVESIDSIDKKSHLLQVELLDFMIRYQLNCYNEEMEKTYANWDTR